MNNELLKVKIVYICQSFYNASKKLIKDISDEKTFSCDEIPCAVNCAFTCELAIKSLLLHYKIKYDYEHSLDKLFFLLPKQLKISIIRELWVNYYKDFSVEYVVDKLFAVSQYFVIIRYMSEDKQILNLYDINAIMEVTFKFCQNICKVHVKESEKYYEENSNYEVINKKIEETERKAIENRKKIKKH